MSEVVDIAGVHTVASFRKLLNKIAKKYGSEQPFAIQQTGRFNVIMITLPTFESSLEKDRLKWKKKSISE